MRRPSGWVCALSILAVSVSLQAQSAPSTLEAGARLMIPSGLDDRDELGIGSWIELKLWGRYAITPALEVGLEVPLLLSQPLDGDESAELFQSAEATLRYHLSELIHADAMAGIGVAQRLMMSPWGGTLYAGGTGSLEPGLGLGGGVRYRAGHLAVHAGAQLRAQLGSGVADDGAEVTGVAAHLPVSVLYDVSDQLGAGVYTGLYTGHELSLDADEGMTVPLVIGGRFAVNQHLAAGAFFGFSTLVTPSLAPLVADYGVADELTFGVFARYER